MAAGRVVLGHVAESVRDRVQQETGLRLPIVETTLVDVPATIRRIAGERDRFHEVARAGAAFARAVHDGRRSAEALAPFLGARVREAA
jgi:hypothetical protein